MFYNQIYENKLHILTSHITITCKWLKYLWLNWASHDKVYMLLE